jgi:hypothetical protein
MVYMIIQNFANRIGALGRPAGKTCLHFAARLEYGSEPKGRQTEAHLSERSPKASIVRYGAGTCQFPPVAGGRVPIRSDAPSASQRSNAFSLLTICRRTII